jgi:hypothetical protein
LLGKIITGLSPKIIPENPTNGITAGKGKEREVVSNKQEHLEVFLSHNTTVQHHWHGRCL